MATRFTLKRKNFAKGFDPNVYRAILSDTTSPDALARKQAYQQKYAAETSAYMSKNAPAVVPKSTPNVPAPVTTPAPKINVPGGNTGSSVLGNLKGAWDGMSKAGKAGTIAGAAVLTGLAAKGLFGGKKKD